jgi:hypothetical protein
MEIQHFYDFKENILLLPFLLFDEGRRAPRGRHIISAAMKNELRRLAITGAARETKRGHVISSFSAAATLSCAFTQ